MGKKREVIARYKIRVFPNEVEVIGPVDDFLFFRKAMNSAERAVLKDIERKKSKRIQVVPSGMIK